MSCDSSATGHIDDVDRDPQVFLQVHSHEAGDSVRAAADGPGTHQRDGLGRVVRPVPAPRKPDQAKAEEQGEGDSKGTAMSKANNFQSFIFNL